MKIKFLVIRFSSIGDVVLTSPVVRCLRNQVKDAEIHFVTKLKHVSVVNSNPYISKVHVLNENMNDLVAELEKERFNFIIDLHQNFRSNRIKSHLNVPSVSFEKLNIRKFLLIQFKINRLPEKHIVDRYLETLSSFGVKNDGMGLDYFIPEDEEFSIVELPQTFQSGYVAFVIAGTYFTKKLPVEKVIEICNNIEFPVILLGGKGEFEEGEHILARSKGNILNFAGKLNLNKSAS